MREVQHGPPLTFVRAHCLWAYQPYRLNQVRSSQFYDKAFTFLINPDKLFKSRKFRATTDEVSLKSRIAIHDKKTEIPNPRKKPCPQTM